MEIFIMGAAGNKKPKIKTAKHDKHVPAYAAEEAKNVTEVQKKKK
ncbi:MAG: RNA-binding protein [Bacteroidales bacterium]